VLFASTHVGLGLLVLARRARNVRQDVLRVRTYARQADQIPQNFCASRFVLLPQGACTLPQSVRFFLLIWPDEGCND
jgi:hypothetical protein